MPFRRACQDFRAGLLVFVALVFASPVWAQDASRDSSDQQDGFCSSMGCRWSAVSAGLLIGSLTVTPANRAERVDGVMLPHASTSNAQITPEDCAACKVNNRPFDVPPGILDKLLSEFGIGHGPNAHSKNGGANGLGESGNGVGGGNGSEGAGASIAGGNSGGASGGSAGGSGANGAGGFAAAAGGGAGVSAAVTAADVTVTPEPQTVVLVATGLIALVPVSRRVRRRR